MPTRFWNFTRRGGICSECVAMLEGSIVLFSMSGSPRGALEGEKRRCRKGKRIFKVDAGYDSLSKDWKQLDFWRTDNISCAACIGE